MNKKSVVISSITVAVLLVLVVASTYAYFQARIASGGQTSTSVGAKTLDSFAINKDNDISLIANQDNFAIGKGDLTSSTTATVSFTARNDKASSYVYYADFYVKNNEFIYSIISDEDKGLGLIDCDNEYDLFEAASKCKYEVDTNLSAYWSAEIGKTRNTFLPGKTFDLYFGFNYEKNMENAKTYFDNSFSEYFSVYDGINYESLSYYEMFNKIDAPKITTASSRNGDYYIIITITFPDDFPVSNGSFKFTNGANAIYTNGYWVMIDRTTDFGQSYTTLPYIQGTPELELTIKKNDNVLVTRDITSVANGSLIISEYYEINEISAEAGKTTTDTWEAVVTFKNLDENQYANVGKTFEGYFLFYSDKDFEDDVSQSNFEKCMQMKYPEFDYDTDYDTFVSENCNGDEDCEAHFNMCDLMWG